VKEILTDCDQDVLQLRVENVGGAACHNGYKSCFYRRSHRGEGRRPASLKLEFTSRRVFDPATVYKKK
jgi:phosphoribosyl-AMP cyclohydrolase